MADEYMEDEEELLENATRVADMKAACNLPSEFTTTGGETYHFHALHSKSLSFTQKMKILDILSRNMKDLYVKSSWGWNENEKNKELFLPTSRFLLLTTSNNPEDYNIVGYCMYRFEWDDEEEPEHPVLYCYEVQVDGAYQKKGVGEFFMKNLQIISDQMKMWKILLTCFKFNTPAMNFYKKLGYGIDHNSPSRHGYEECYEILSNKPNKR
jgi:ribosomal protein S18 acetylase RimI-like enzyme